MYLKISLVGYKILDSYFISLNILNKKLHFFEHKAQNQSLWLQYDFLPLYIVSDFVHSNVFFSLYSILFLWFLLWKLLLYVCWIFCAYLLHIPDSLDSFSYLYLFLIFMFPLVFICLFLRYHLLYLTSFPNFF